MAEPWARSEPVPWDEREVELDGGVISLIFLPLRAFYVFAFGDFNAHQPDTIWSNKNHFSEFYHGALFHYCQ